VGLKVWNTIKLIFWNLSITFSDGRWSFSITACIMIYEASTNHHRLGQRICKWS
jgi:hypothetical protein